MCKDVEAVDLDAEEWASDINNVASVVKLWLRELPDPLFTYSLHQDFIEAASASTSTFASSVEALLKLTCTAGIEKRQITTH